MLFRHDLRAIRIKSVCRQNNLDKKYLKAKLQACLDDAGMPIINRRVRTVFHVSSDIIEYQPYVWVEVPIHACSEIPFFSPFDVLTI